MTRNWPADRLLFITGCPRSGTSVLKKILRSHTSFVTVGIEHGYLLPMIDELGPRAPSIDQALDVFERNAWAFGNGATPRTPEAWGQRLDQPIDWDCFFARLYGLHAEAADGPVLVLQYPGPGILRCEELAAIFPAASFLSLERDPRANVSSQLAAFDARRSTLRSVRLWKQCIRAAESAESAIGLLRVRYEDLVADPTTVLANICEFSCVTWDASILDFEVSMPDIATDRTVERRTFTRLDPTLSEKWRAGLAPHQIWLVERMTRREMQDLRYGPSTAQLQLRYLPLLVTDAIRLIRDRLSRSKGLA